MPETLMAPLQELAEEYERARGDGEFQEELRSLLSDYCGRPTPLYHAQRWSEMMGGAKVYLKREDLLHTGAHKINNAIGQALMARRLGKKRIIAETGAGQRRARGGRRGAGRLPLAGTHGASLAKKSLAQICWI